MPARFLFRARRCELLLEGNVTELVAQELQFRRRPSSRRRNWRYARCCVHEGREKENRREAKRAREEVELALARSSCTRRAVIDIRHASISSARRVRHIESRPNEGCSFSTALLRRRRRLPRRRSIHHLIVSSVIFTNTKHSTAARVPPLH